MDSWNILLKQQYWQKGDGFQHLRNKFGLEKSEARLKGNIVIGPEIRELMLDDEFTSKLMPDELIYWEAFVLFVKNFLEPPNQRVEKYMPTL